MKKNRRYNRSKLFTEINDYALAPLSVLAAARTIDSA